MTDLTAYQTMTPLGVFTVLVGKDAAGADAAGGTGADVVHAAGFTDSVERLALLAGAEPGAVQVSAEDHEALAAVRKYFDGDLGALDSVRTLERAGAASFRTAARRALRAIPAGTTATYTQLAASAGSPRAIRAAGSACATNPTALFVPCHRVVRADGSLGGFLYGLDVKRALLDHEAKCAA